ncbi:SMI1/KNR4 family protein [Streptomyces sp. KR55]|uniref:SMI1/KNR4 family protein n=1 Tax=Streptomyces sp. KR55 TaxID=3457425 RepID=UPI003FD40609
MSLANLIGLMPPHQGAGTVVDWQLAERAYGVRFPADYQAFMARYGGGTIENYLTVLEPAVSADGRAEGPMTFISEEARETWGNAPGPDGLDVPAEHVLAWGCDGTGDLLCWLTTGDTPDAWPVAIYNRGDNTWIVADCGVVEFLYRVLSVEDDDDSPLSGVMGWGQAGPRFLTGAEERRIKATGRDPWPDTTE